LLTLLTGRLEIY